MDLSRRSLISAVGAFLPATILQKFSSTSVPTPAHDWMIDPGPGDTFAIIPREPVFSHINIRYDTTDWRCIPFEKFADCVSVQYNHESIITYVHYKVPPKEFERVRQGLQVFIDSRPCKKKFLTVRDDLC